ncbi:serine/threonine-protein kinase [Janibacter sp. GS2]|uniref:serine/threonine-protein kinase n=1 Tax=Janibacter sp. GS2 TaxID=3442646 RepID=UPI003EBA1C89
MDEIPPEVPGYRLTRLLGTGSTSSVWRARREADDELVAVKVLPGEAPDELVREFTLLQHAAGEHVVTLHETLALDGGDGPATALVLELFAGGSLAEVVAARGHLSPGETVTVIAPAAQALTGLHELGVVHGDLSPGNLLLDSTGRPALADLGFARLTGEPPGDVHGTDGFVAPEVLDGGEPDRASDVYALASLAWLCLTGSPPGHVAERGDLASVVPAAAALVAAVEAGLSSDPAARPEADGMALAVFDAVAAEPLRMTSTGDIASGLTRRLREAATDGSAAVPAWQRELEQARPEGPRRRWWQRRERRQRATKGEDRPTSRAGRHAAPRRAAPQDAASPVRDIARQAAAGPAGRWVGAAVTAALALLLAVLVPWQQLATAGGGRGSSPTGTAAEPAGTGSVAAVLTDRSAPRRSPVRLARELTALRQAVVVDRDADALEQLVEPDSPEERRERALLERLRSSGERYHGVELSVRSARLESTSGSTAVLRTTTDESAYAVVRADGQREQRPARPGQQVDLVLSWDGTTWRVREVTEAG